MNYITYDLETLSNCFVGVFKSHKSNAQKVFTICGDLGIDQSKELKSFLEQFKDYYFVGFNNLGFDGQVIERFLQGETTAEQIYQVAQDVIDGNGIDYWKLSTKQLDVYKLSYFDSPVKRTSLKALQINLRWKNCQEMPIHHSEKIVSKKQLDDVIEYCINDVESTHEYFKRIQGEIQLRIDLGEKYKVTVLNSSNTAIAKKVFKKEYTRITGFDKYDDIKIPKPSRVKFKDVIAPQIKFETKEFQDILEYFKSKNSDNFKPLEKVLSGKIKVVYALGGLHSVNDYQYYEEDSETLLLDQDFGSFYILLQLWLQIYPPQLGNQYLTVLNEIVTQRLKAKKSGDTLTAAVMKIVVLSLFGLMGNQYFYGYSPELIYRVTINGQLVISMLIEKLMLKGFTPFMVNTDGSSWKVPKDREQEFYDICNQFTKEIRGDIEYQKFKQCIFQSVNDYLIEAESGKLKKKGDFLTEFDYHQNNSAAIVNIALERYFIKGIPVEETIRNWDSVWEFCMKVKAGGEFYYELITVINGKLVTEEFQKNNRYLICNSGGVLKKTETGVINESMDEFFFFGESSLIESKQVKKSTSFAEVHPQKGKTWYIRVVNQIESEKASDYDINRGYYIWKCNERINKFNLKQIKL